VDPNTYYDYPPNKGFFENIGSQIIDFIQTLVVFGAIFALIYIFVAQFHKVQGQSMFPTIHNGDFLVTEKISYRLGEPKRGQIVVLKNPRDESVDFIKRIIALPGDQIKIEQSRFFLNGGVLNEPYLPPGTTVTGENFLKDGEAYTLGPNQYFVAGDNRKNSSDSRDFGPIGKEKLIGRAFFRYWPPQSVGLIINK